MANQYVNKVNLADGTSIIDISDTTATADKILQGYGAYGKDGAWMAGTAVAGSGSAVTVVDTPDSHGGTIRTITAVSLAGDTVSAAHLESGYTAHDALGNPITGTLSPGGGSSKNIQVNSGAGSVRTTAYSSTGISITVAKAGTYNVSWMAWKSSSSGTMGTNLYKNGNAGTNQTTWTNNYGQHITLSNQTYAAGDVLTLYAVASSTSRYCGAGNLIIEEQ